MFVGGGGVYIPWKIRIQIQTNRKLLGWDQQIHNV